MAKTINLSRVHKKLGESWGFGLGILGNESW
jgi:hypothetical protein